MAITLYKPGDTHIVRGVVCEMGRFDLNELQTMLDKGWKKSPHELGDAPQKEPVDEPADELVSLDDADLKTLKGYAKEIGVGFPANIGADKLRAKIREALDD